MHRCHYYVDVRSESLPSPPPLFVEEKRSSQKEFYCSLQRPQHLCRTMTVNRTKVWGLSFVTLNRELCPPFRKKWLEGAPETTEFDVKTKPDNYNGKMAETQWKAPGTRRFIKNDIKDIKVILIKLLLLIRHRRRKRNCNSRVFETGCL